MRCSSRVLIVCALLMAVGQVPVMGSVIFSGTNGNGLEASALFTVANDRLQVVLTNTSSVDVLDPAALLSGVFFKVPSGVGLAPISATLASGSTVWFGPDGGGNVGGEWAYATVTNIGGYTGANQGISSAGLGVFGAGNFNGSSLFLPDSSVDGADYNITSAGDNPLTGNAKVKGEVPVIYNSVTFSLSISGSLQESDIGNVMFQYGTVLTDAHFPGEGHPVPVPEPTTFLMLAAGLVGLLGCARLCRT
jgi:hypothetical protein